MKWFARTFDQYSVEWVADQDRLAQLQLTIAEQGADYTKVLMVLVKNSDDTETVYIGVPTSPLGSIFVGYEPVEKPDRHIASLLLGSPEEFTQYFRKPDFSVAP
jgi:hypothetical protein